METYKIVTAFIVATALYAGALNGLNEQLLDNGIKIDMTKSQVQENQKQIDKLITEIAKLHNDESKYTE